MQAGGIEKVKKMKKVKFISIALFLIMILSINSFAEKPTSPEGNNYLDKINPDVQVQDNGWLKIFDEFKEIKTPEEYWRDKTISDETHRESLIKSESARVVIHRTLNVKIQFLKPCIATKLKKSDPFQIFDIGSPDWIDIFVPKFRCDYRFKVFVTFFSSDGIESETKSTYPLALWTDSLLNKRKTEMFPGEKKWVSFYPIPSNATSWYVWLSK